MAIPGTPGFGHIASSLEHIETGTPNYSPEVHQKMSEKRARKIAVVPAQEADTDVLLDDPHARVGIISWGSTRGAILEAREHLLQDGIHTAYLHPKLLWPIQEQLIGDFIRRFDKVLVLEENFSGQFARLIRAQFLYQPVSVCRAGGAPFTPGEIYKCVKEAVKP